MNYYNDTEIYCADWIQCLIDMGAIPQGTVDSRGIQNVKPKDLEGYRQCHFFAGVGGWPYALQLAGWPLDWPAWTGSCPCQPFSAAGKRQGAKDERHLWPAWRRLIAECRPPAIFGEQVASKAGREWLAGVRTDLEELGYAVGAADLCAASVGTPHVRQRLFWVAYAGSPAVRRQSGNRNGKTCPFEAETRQWQRRGVDAGDCRTTGGLGHTHGRQSPINPEQSDSQLPPPTGASWSDARWVACRDGFARRISAEPGNEPLAHGISRSVGHGQPRLVGLAPMANRNRIGRLSGYGNAIVPQVASAFIAAFMEAV